MKTEEKKDDFIRKLIRQQPPEKAPDGFTGKVMEKIQTDGAPEHEPIFSPMVWFAIFAGAAAIVTTMILLDIPLLKNIFSSSGIQKLSFNIFTSQFLESFQSLFQSIDINLNILIIILAGISLVVVERVLAARKSSQKMMLL
jgi:hypothetical protein